MSDPLDEEMAREIDFSNGVRGLHYKDLSKGYTVNIKKEDGTVEVRRYGPNHVLIDVSYKKVSKDSNS